MTFQKSPMVVFMLALLLILVGATGYRIITAIDTHPGLVTQDAYLSGESYGETLDYKRQLKQQGWTLNLIIPTLVTHDVVQTYIAQSAKNGTLLNTAKAVAYFYRPLEKRHDFSKIMQVNDSGAYQTQVKLPLKGRWDVVVEITKGDFLQRTSAKMFAQ